MKEISSPWLNFELFSAFRLIRQSETSECGLACVAMIATHFGHEVNVTNLRREIESSARGLTARDLAVAGERLGMSTRTVRCDLTELLRLRLPAILHWNLGHYVVLHKVRGRKLFIADPSAGLMSLRVEEASPHFSGIAMEFAPTPLFERQKVESGLSIRKLLRPSPTLTRAFIHALLLSMLLQAALLTVPIYMQMVIDEGIQRGDSDILIVLLIAVLAVTVFAAVASLLRGLTVQFMTQLMAFDMNSAVFNHLVRLPLPYFQKRQVGDLQQRFRSLGPIQQALGAGAVASLIDGALSIVTLLLMFFYSGILTAMVLVFTALTILVRVMSIAASRNAAGAVLVAEAREQSRFLESLRAIATIKVNAVENARSDTWRSNNAATINAIVRRGNIAHATGAINQLLTGVSDAVILYFGARMALGGELTLGVLTAFLAYKQLFAARIGAFVDQLIVFSLLDVQLERVSDIMLTQREPKIDEIPSGNLIEGQVELKGVSFQYSSFDPWILQGVDLKIEAGEFVAITGPSGGGKSTLLRLLVGLNVPTSGGVFYDGRPLSAWGPRAIREQTSFVLQDDQLFAGTILDNITQFSSVPDLDRVQWALDAAAISEEIKALPMGLGSLIGDMGSLLSGGQRQRLLIARALYRRPRLLIMDEGTSHLDLRREHAINKALSELSITRIIVAHRPETIKAAHRVLALSDRGIGTMI